MEQVRTKGTHLGGESARRGRFSSNHPQISVAYINKILIFTHGSDSPRVTWEPQPVRSRSRVWANGAAAVSNPDGQMQYSGTATHCPAGGPDEMTVAFMAVLAVKTEKNGQILGYF